MRIEEAKGVLQIGARVETNGDDSEVESKFFTGTVSHIEGNRFCILRDDGKKGAGPERSWQIKWANADATVKIISHPNPEQGTSHMSNILDFFKSITASEAEKLRLKHGLEQPIGTPTAKGLELSALISYQANLAKVDEVVAKLEAAEKDKAGE